MKSYLVPSYLYETFVDFQMNFDVWLVLYRFFFFSNEETNLFVTVTLLKGNMLIVKSLGEF